MIKRDVLVALVYLRMHRGNAFSSVYDLPCKILFLLMSEARSHALYVSLLHKLLLFHLLLLELNRVHGHI